MWRLKPGFYQIIWIFEFQFKGIVFGLKVIGTLVESLKFNLVSNLDSTSS